MPTDLNIAPEWNLRIIGGTPTHGVLHTFEEAFAFRNPPRPKVPKMKTTLTEMQKKDVLKINDAIEFCVSEDESSYVYLVAVCKDGTMNGIQKLENKGGDIVGVLVYDQVNDRHHIPAMAVHKVGTIPISYTMRLKGNPSWHAYVPMPEEVIMEHLSSKQKFGIKTFKEKMGEACNFHYIHFTGYF